MKPIPSHLLSLAVALALVVCGCKVKTSFTSNSTLSSTLSSGRNVKATIDGFGSIQSGGDTATISFSGHKLAVEKARLLLDGGEVAKLPPTATNIEIVVSNRTLNVTADSANVLRTMVAK